MIINMKKLLLYEVSNTLINSDFLDGRRILFGCYLALCVFFVPEIKDSNF